jgi:hypothetical protein
MRARDESEQRQGYRRPPGSLRRMSGGAPPHRLHLDLHLPSPSDTSPGRLSDAPERCLPCTERTDGPAWPGSGPEGIRTPDLLPAEQALYQLSYRPAEPSDFISESRAYLHTAPVVVVGKEASALVNQSSAA